MPWRLTFRRSYTCLRCLALAITKSCCTPRTSSTAQRNSIRGYGAELGNSNGLLAPPPSRTPAAPPAGEARSRVVAFLEHLLREVPGQMVIIWDGSPIHRRHIIQEFLAKGPRNASTWSSCRRMPQSSFLTRASGNGSLAWSRRG